MIRHYRQEKIIIKKPELDVFTIEEILSSAAFKHRLESINLLILRKLKKQLDKYLCHNIILYDK